MCRHAGFWWQGAQRRELTHGSGACSDGSSGEQLCGLCGLCCGFSLSVSLLLLFPLFAVLLNCPYPDPPVSACFFPFSSAPWRGEGRPRGAFVAGRSQTITICNNKTLVQKTSARVRKIKYITKIFGLCMGAVAYNLLIAQELSKPWT